MYYGSDEFNNAIENTQGNALKTRLKFSDEEIIELVSSMRYYGGSNDADDLSIGNVVSAYVEVSAFTNEMLTGREFLLESGVKLSDGTYEYAPIGYFTVQTPSGDYDEVSFTAYDRMIKFEKVYNSSLTHPTDSATVLDELCTMCGVTLATPITSPITITENLKGYTCREVLGYIAGIHGFFACIDRFGELNLRWYSDTPIEKSLRTVWAFEKSQEQYEVEKVEVAKDSETSFTSGNGIITLHHSNPYATQDITNNLFIKLDGYTYMPAEIEMLDDIRMDPWDVISVTYYDDIAYNIPCMSITHDFGGASTTVKAVGKTSNENEYRFTGPTIRYLNRMATDLLVANRVIATKVDAEYVQAHAITTDNLDAISANIKNAVIEEVEADFVRTENLEAIQAEITEAVIGDLEADFATIKQLDTVNANIEQLDTGVANINTLIFGSASGTVIQTEFSNSVIAQLGDAQIKSAMIESVSAGKITAGDIITNNVRVMSEDGSLIISDETMQISDGTRVRVQIGKDASNDYSINIWDANGNLMFSKGGITDSAIKEAIIRNDMVSDTANISASKLNIESLFSEINGSTNTIKATKIYLDDSSQTLDVAFTSMNNTVDNLQSVQTSQGTQISAIQGQITSKIWEQDITTAIFNMDIGGRNLILASDNVYTKTTTTSQTNQNFNIGKFSDYYFAKRAVGAQLTLSFDWETDATSGTFIPQFNNTPWSGFAGSIVAISTANQSGKYVHTITLTNAQVADTATYTGLYVRGDKIGGTLTIKNVKCEFGIKATDWTPAPEDTESQITTLNTNYSSLNQTVNSISTTVGSHTTSLNGLSTRVTSAESNITQLSTEIDLRVKKDGVIAAINLSSETALIQASKINLVGAVTITSLDTDLTSLIDRTKTTAEGAQAHIAAWAYNNDATYIDGGNIFAKSVTAAQINVEDLFAQDITATGTIRGVNLVGAKGQIGNWDISNGGLHYEDGTFDVLLSPPSSDNGEQVLSISVYDENLDAYITEGYIGFDGKGRPYTYMYEYQGTLADIQQIDATTVTATYVQTKAGADLDKINSNLNVYKSEMNDLRHLGTFYAKTTAQTFNINNISGYKTLVFIGMDDTGTLQLDSVFVPTRQFKMENIGVSINCYAWQNYRGIIAVRYVSDTSIICLATEIMGWSEVGFRVYGMI